MSVCLSVTSKWNFKENFCTCRGRRHARRRLPPPGTHTCTHAQMDGQDENNMPTRRKDRDTLVRPHRTSTPKMPPEVHSRVFGRPQIFYRVVMYVQGSTEQISGVGGRTAKSQPPRFSREMTASWTVLPTGGSVASTAPAVRRPSLSSTRRTARASHCAPSRSSSEPSYSAGLRGVLGLAQRRTAPRTGVECRTRNLQ